MVRIILALIFVILILIISIPVWLILEAVGLFSEHSKEMASLYIVRFAFRVILLIAGTKTTYIGEENIPKDTAVLFVGNHRSYFDIIAQGRLLTRPTSFIGKKEFGKVPVFGLWIKNLRFLLIDRNDIKQGLKTVLTAIEYIRSGRSVFVYPEGTRNRTEEPLLPFKEGSMKISTKSGCPIIPVSVAGAADVFENHFPKLKKAHVIVHYGAPIYPSELSRDELKFLGKYTAGKIMEMLDGDIKLIGGPC
ncbi:MAG: 1-acyl-sn-glycerol-3-phosphate acyltransferase [Lachnospiraceae bacterium]|nr:1-acyl-sn-glycerol-3-phosphate acyltransferase [Lachnospiraceae bacterium]